MNKNNSYGLRSSVLKELSDGFYCIHNNFKYLKALSKSNQNVIGATEWLLDNIYLIEKEYKSIKSCMPFDYFKGLFIISESVKDDEDKNKVPRIFELAKNYINRGGEIDSTSLIQYINNIQDEGTALTMGELWAFPLMIRISIIINLAKYTDELVDIQKEIIKGKTTAERVIDAINKNTLKSELEIIGDEYEKFTPILLREFIKVLKNNSIENESVYNFARSKLGIESDFNKIILKSNLKEQSLEDNIGTYITYIRKIEGISWRLFFDKTSLVDKILSDDPENIYKSMDFETKDYYRHRLEQICKTTLISEIDLAKEALELARKAKSNNKEPYRCHVGYYIVDDGIKEIKGKYHAINEVISEPIYLLLNVLGTLIFSWLILLISTLLGAIFTKIQYIISFCIMLIPINEIIIALTNWSVSKFIDIRLVPKLDLSQGIPEKYKTVVVIPAIVNSKERVIELMNELEVAYCGNKDKNIYFALLSDLNDSDKEVDEKDSEIINAGIEMTKKLNGKYCEDKHSNETKFFFLSRKRIYNKKQGVYMAKERKRGKLMEFMALIRGSDEHTYDVISSNIDLLRDVKYLITLDADTFMIRESAFKLIGAMGHVLNTPYIDKSRVVRGYGIMQPKVSISLEAKNKTHFSRIFGGEGGVDGYSIAYSDTYQDLFGEGSFTGKGIIDIDAFYNVLHDTIMEDKILSHDLLEGGIARCALVSDVEFIDGYPAYYESSARRLHRWTRGDWQLIGWLFSKKLTALYKWKIFDNLRRSLLAPNLLIAVLLSLTFLKESSQITLLCFLGAIIPLVFTVTDFVVTPKNRLMGTFKTFEQILLILTFIPYQAYLMIHAILITLFRVFISKRNLLEWETAENVERKHKNSFKSYLRRMWISPIMGVLVLYLSLPRSFAVFTYSNIISLLWIVSPYVAYSISKNIPINENHLEDEEKTYLRKISRRIWAYYQDFVNEEDNYLAPDNYQEKPLKGVAHRTSPTNMGMGLISNVVAYDLGYVSMEEFIVRVEQILSSMQELKMIHGHYLNWYDTKTREPLWPRYISTVDSGNLLGYLWVLKKSMKDLKENPLIRVEEIEALKDIYHLIEDEGSSVKIRFASEISIGDYLEILKEILFKIQNIKRCEENKMTSNKEAKYWIDKLTDEVKSKIKHYNYIFAGLEKLYSHDFLEGVPNITELINRAEEFKEKNGDNFNNILTEKIKNFKDYSRRIDKICEKINEISEAMDFKFLYDKTRGLFSIGYNVEEDSLGNSYYDLLASESRGASFIAIAKNDVPNSHWFKLSRAMTNAFHTHSLISWSGTMFEYFMPSLIMKNYPKTLFSQTYKSVIKAQLKYAKQKKIPWGISESAFYQFDVQDNYQYKAFGIPGLGLKRGLEDELVISPYSTLMILPFAQKQCIRNLKRLEKLGALGRYGFIESLDYTKARQDNYIFTVSNKNGEEYVDNCGYNVDNFKLEYNGEFRPEHSVDKNNELKNNDKVLDEQIFNDGVKPNKVVTYMVHHLGMSFMALDNILNDNALIKKFHSLPEVKSTELLLKEKIPQNVTFERDEDFSLKNKYVEGEELISRKFNGIDHPNTELLLLSNGEYSSMITLAGSGYSKKNDMMIYRWKGDSTSDDSGLFFYIKNLNSNDYWSATYEPCKNLGYGYSAEFNLDKAKFNRKDGNIETQMEVVISTENNFEVRKLTLNNLGESGRSLEITSYMEITLTGFSADSVHPAFSNLFIQTEYNEQENVLIGSRRGRVKGAKVPYVFHKAVVNGDMEGAITYETSRLNFIGRNRELKYPSAMDNDKALENTVGTVLDPIMSLRIKIRLEPHEEKEIYYITGTSDLVEDALEICREYNFPYKLERIFSKYTTKTQIELKNFEIKSSQANMFQRLASYIFFVHSGRKDREEYINNISKHQKDLWAYGISGDIPIVMVVVQSEDDIDIVNSMLKFHYYLKIKGVKLDLVIYNNEKVSYDEPLQKSIMQSINICNEASAINKSGGIFIHNKATMGNDIKDLLIGIARVYMDSEKGSILNQIEEFEEKNLLLTKEVSLEELRTHSNIHKLEEIAKPLKVQNTNDSYADLKETEEQKKDEEYHEYDHDQDIIQNDDLINGIENKGINNLLNDNNDNDLNQDFKYQDFKVENLQFFNGYGGFDKDDNSYVIKLSDYKNTPAPWINVISNDDFGFHISESGSSYTWCGNSRENKITPWSNDYVRDPLGEALYIRDDILGKYFSITPKPVRDSGDYLIKHSFGYSEFKHTAYDLDGKLEVFAPRGEKVKIQRVTLENISNKDREISLFYYARLVLGVYEYDSSKYISTYIEANGKNYSEQPYIRGKNPYSEYFGKLNAYLTIVGGENISFTGDRKEFIGLGGEMVSPEALKHSNLSNRCGGIYDPCLAASTKITLKPNEKKEVLILFGQDEENDIVKIIDKYKEIRNAEIELDKVKKYWRDFLGNIQVKTPDESLDHLLNGWLLYQTLSCRYLSRTAFYQSGGAYGFRDQLQDSMALGVVQPEIPKAQILRSASRQYIEGDVQHWWHPVVNSGIRTRFSDDLLWLPYVTAEYINSTGDYDILDSKAPYLEDEPLREGEDERYTIVNQSSKEGTIYEHCLKAIEKSLKFGSNNIPLMGSGDWNDGMSTVGNEGKGESVWLGWFLYSILGSFIEIAQIKCDEETKNHYEERREFIRENIEKNAWDGGWYRRAYFDDGTPLGSRENPECQIDSLAQTWAIISGATSHDEIEKNKLQKKAENTQLAEQNSEITFNKLTEENNEIKFSKPQFKYSDRAIEAMEAVDTNLVKEDKGMILLLAPPFSNSFLEPGYIKGYVPGVRENGGQYTHAAVWVILALTKLGLGEKAVKYYNMINPINHTNTELECMTYKLEPYVMAADVYIKEPHGGRGGWSWYTGASGWMYKIGIENILGLKKVKDKGYIINPCVPKDWNEFEIKITNEKEDYSIKVMRDSNLKRTEISKSNTNNIDIGERAYSPSSNTDINETKVIINGEIKKDGIIPRNLGCLKIEVYI